MRVLVTDGDAGVVARTLRAFHAGLPGTWAFGDADLRSSFDTDVLFCRHAPTHVVHFEKPHGNFVDEARAAVNVVDACRRHRVRALVVCRPRAQDHPPTPTGPLSSPSSGPAPSPAGPAPGADDSIARILARRLALESGVRRADLAFPDVFGPYFDPDSREMVPTLVRRGVADAELFCANPAERTVAYSRDAAAAVVAAVQGRPPVLPTWKLPVRDLARVVAGVCGCRFEGGAGPSSPAPPAESTRDLRVALEATVGWYLATQDGASKS